MLKITDNESDDVLLIVLQMANNLFGISYKNLVEIDSELSTCDTDKTDWTQNAQDILFNKNDIEESPDEDDNLDESKQDICTVVEMNQYTEKMKAFAIAHGDVQLLAALNTVDERCTAICITGLSQTKITDFFKTVTA
jgi:DNA repair ATPase RecN